MDSTLNFGAHFAPDGNTYVDADGAPAHGACEGMTVERTERGFSFGIGNKWEMYELTLDPQQVRELITFLVESGG